MPSSDTSAQPRYAHSKRWTRRRTGYCSGGPAGDVQYALEGIRVLDPTRVLAGPICGRTLCTVLCHDGARRGRGVTAPTFTALSRRGELPRVVKARPSTTSIIPMMERPCVRSCAIRTYSCRRVVRAGSLHVGSVPRFAPRCARESCTRL
jgi:hypothetical protein